MTQPSKYLAKHLTQRLTQVTQQLSQQVSWQLLAVSCLVSRMRLVVVVIRIKAGNRIIHGQSPLQLLSPSK